MRAAKFQRWGLVVGLASAGLGQAPAWTWVGPAALTTPPPISASFAGPMAALALPPNAPAGTMLAGGVGGVWRLQGGAWQPLSPGQPVSALAISSDGSTIYAGGGDRFDAATRAGGGVWASSDGGGMWSRDGAATLGGLAIAALAADPAQPGHVLAAAVVAADSPAGVQPGVYATSDGGATWALALAGTFTTLSWQGGAVLAAGPTGVDLSQDGGQTFAPVAAALPPMISDAAACAAPAGGFELLLAVNAGAVLWQLDATGAGAPVGLPAGFAAGSLAVAAGDGGLWVGGGNGVWASGNGGATWSPATTAGSLEAGGAHALLASSHGLWLANDYGVWNQAAGSWLAQAPGLSNAAPLAMALTGGGAVATLDAAGLAAGAVGASADWALNGAAPRLAALAAAPGGGTLYGLDSAGGVWQSGDGGMTWLAQAPPPALSGTPTALAASSAGLWLGSSAGEVLGPGGETAALPSAVAALSAGADLWAAAGERLLASSDGGQSWKLSGLAPGPVAALAADPVRPDLIAVATPAGVHASLDGGASWINLGAGLPAAPVTALAFDANETLWAATLGRGVWSLPLAAAEAALTLAPAPAAPPVGTALNLAAQLTALGAPVAGAAVTFAASVNGQSGWSATALTGADGLAYANFTPTQAQPTAIAASAGGITATQSFTPAPLGAASIAVSGAGQSALEGHTLSVTVTVHDAYGNPVPGAAVSFAAAAGSFAPAQAIADANGAAGSVFTLPVVAGAVALSAVSGAASAHWSETALPAPDFALVLTPPAAAAAPNQLATLSLQVAAIGGYSAAVPLRCDSPPGACTVTPDSVTPGQSAVVSVNVGAWDQDESSVAVQVSSQGTHRVAATLPLEAFTLAASAQAVAVATGSAAPPLTLTLTPLNGLAGPVTLSATLSDGSPLPAALAAAFQPAGASLANGTAATVQLTLVAGAAGSAGLAWLGWLALGLAGMATRRWRRALRLGTVTGLALALAACGGGAADPPPADPPPAPTVYALVVTANAAGLVASVPLTVTVTQ